MAVADRPGHFHGGLTLPAHKRQSTGSPLRTAAIPEVLIHPLSQHVGAPAEAIVEPGEKVLRGQPVARAAGYVGSPVHAGSSGTVVEIAPRPVPHPSGLSADCVVIRTDGEDRPFEGYDPLTNYRTLNAPALRARVRECGIVGLGGAAFPTSVKLNVGVGLRSLILNAAECEPFISCDDTLLRHRSEEVVLGAQVMLHALEIRHCLIGIEDDKPEAREALTAAVARIGDDRIEVLTVPAHYPSGGERQLIQLLTGHEVPAQGIPADIGYLCHNVGTAAAVARAVLRGEPLISRIVTVTGSGVSSPTNLEVRLGTPMADLIDECGGYTANARYLIMGGAMMGFPLERDDLPVIKATNCLLAASEEDIRPREETLACIRCGDCASVCPANLLPQQLQWYTRANDFEQVEALNLYDCIECGCCDLVCPSHIPLTQYFRYAKTEIWSRKREREQSDHARERFEARKSRLEEQARARQRRLAAKTRALGKAGKDEAARKAMIDEVMQRVRAKKKTDEDQDKGE
ncbi:MAG: electron transporter RnfC [Gammaproteobacteria bacterium SG8_31]|nr:MAG: electron transporter RnfC [Gammaproteobacteria bacterium SG8_31]